MPALLSGASSRGKRLKSLMRRRPPGRSAEPSGPLRSAWLWTAAILGTTFLHAAAIATLSAVRVQPPAAIDTIDVSVMAEGEPLTEEARQQDAQQAVAPAPQQPASPLSDEPKPSPEPAEPPVPPVPPPASPAEEPQPAQVPSAEALPPAAAVSPPALPETPPQTTTPAPSEPLPAVPAEEALPLPITPPPAAPPIAPPEPERQLQPPPAPRPAVAIPAKPVPPVAGPVKARPKPDLRPAAAKPPTRAPTGPVPADQRPASEVHRLGVPNGQPVQQGMTRETYAAIVNAEINRHRFYPETARAGGVTGRVVVEFTIGGLGTATRVAIAATSGNAALDEAARQAVRAIRVPPPPGGAFSARKTFDFSLR